MPSAPRSFRRHLGDPAGCNYFLLSCALCLFLFAVSVSAGPAEQQANAADLNKAQSLFKNGCKESEKKNYPAAESLFNQALEAYPLLPGAYVELGKIQMAQGNPAKALELYLKAKETYIALHDARQKDQMRQQADDRDYAQKGQDANMAGRTGGFAKSFGKSSQDARKEDNRQVVSNADATADIPALFYLYLGGAYLRLNKAAEAETELLAGIAKDGKLAPLHFNLAVSYLMQGKYQESATEASAAKKLGFQLPPPFVKDLETRGKVKVE